MFGQFGWGVAWGPEHIKLNKFNMGRLKLLRDLNSPRCEQDQLAKLTLPMDQ